LASNLELASPQPNFKNQKCQGLGLCQGQSQTGGYLMSMKGRKKGEMTPFLDGGCQKYGGPLVPATQYVDEN